MSINEDAFQNVICENDDSSTILKASPLSVYN